MPIAQDRADYFWLAANDPVTTEMPEPETFTGSKVTPLIDMEEYVDQLRAAFATVGTDVDPNQNQGDFIYIAGWWLGLLRGKIAPPETGFGSTGFTVAETEGFTLDPTNATNERLIDILKEKSRRGVDVRVMGWIGYAVMPDRPYPLRWRLPVVQPAIATRSAGEQRGTPGWRELNAQTINTIKDCGRTDTGEESPAEHSRPFGGGGSPQGVHRRQEAGRRQHRRHGLHRRARLRTGPLGALRARAQPRLGRRAGDADLA